MRALAREAITLSSPRGRLVAFGALGLGLLVAGPERLERGPQLCLISMVIRRPCPACGITRASAALMRGHVRQAIAYNRRILLLAPVIAMVLVMDIRAVVTGFGRTPQRLTGENPPAS